MNKTKYLKQQNPICMCGHNKKDHNNAGDYYYECKKCDCREYDHFYEMLSNYKKQKFIIRLITYLVLGFIGFSIFYLGFSIGLRDVTYYYVYSPDMSDVKEILKTAFDNCGSYSFNRDFTFFVSLKDELGRNYFEYKTLEECYNG